MKTLLNQRKDIYHIVHESMSSDDMMSKLACSPVDIIITDLCMPSTQFPDGLTMVRKLVRDHPHSLIVVVTMITNTGLHELLRGYGVKVLTKNVMLNELLNILNRSLRATSTTVKMCTALTQREIEVVRLLLSGMTVSGISKLLNRTKQTISSQKKSAMNKLGAANDFELFKCAQLAGLGTALVT
jgi:two-component system capsular synthesis response regulator RcsB